jgi:hypothetical protein
VRRGGTEVNEGTSAVRAEGRRGVPWNVEGRRFHRCLSERPSAEIAGGVARASCGGWARGSVAGVAGVVKPARLEPKPEVQKPERGTRRGGTACVGRLQGFLFDVELGARGITSAETERLSLLSADVVVPSLGVGVGRFVGLGGLFCRGMME